jgi:enoyl-CoA hydratase/carnithine racemase
MLGRLAPIVEDIKKDDKVRSVMLSRNRRACSAGARISWRSERQSLRANRNSYHYMNELR